MLSAFVVSCAAEIDVLKEGAEITDTNPTSSTVEFTEHQLAESQEKPAGVEFVLEDNDRVTLVNKISETETIIYTNGGYSFKYNEEDNHLEKFEVTKTHEDPECKEADVKKRYVTGEDIYWVWIVKKYRNKKDKKYNNKDQWALLRCSNGVETTRGQVNVPVDAYEKKEPLLLYLKPQDSDDKAEALIYSHRQLFIWSNHFNDSKAGEEIGGASLVKKNKDGNIQELLPRAEARENAGMLGGITSTAEGVTVWLKNDDGAAVYRYQGNTDGVPQFENGILEIDVQDDSNKQVDKFAIWLPSDKTTDGLPKTIEGKIVGVSKEKKLLVGDSTEDAVVEQPKD